MQNPQPSCDNLRSPYHAFFALFFVIDPGGDLTTLSLFIAPPSNSPLRVCGTFNYPNDKITG